MRQNQPKMLVKIARQKYSVFNAPQNACQNHSKIVAQINALKNFIAKKYIKNVYENAGKKWKLGFNLSKLNISGF